MRTPTLSEFERTSRTLNWLRIFSKRKIRWIKIYQFIRKYDKMDGCHLEPCAESKHGKIKGVVRSKLGLSWKRRGMRETCSVRGM
jgi:hypothetical protein